MNSSFSKNGDLITSPLVVHSYVRGWKIKMRLDIGTKIYIQQGNGKIAFRCNQAYIEEIIASKKTRSIFGVKRYRRTRKVYADHDENIKFIVDDYVFVRNFESFPQNGIQFFLM